MSGTTKALALPVVAELRAQLGSEELASRMLRQEVVEARLARRGQSPNAGLGGWRAVAKAGVRVALGLPLGAETVHCVVRDQSLDVGTEQTELAQHPPHEPRARGTQHLLWRAVCKELRLRSWLPLGRLLQRGSVTPRLKVLRLNAPRL